MKLLTGLFLAAKKRLMTRDSGADEFKTKIDELVSRKDELTAENVASRVDELKKLTDDIPDGDEKSKLVRFLEDFKAVKEYSPEVAKEAASDVSKLYESLCADALKDAPDANANSDGGENGEQNGGKANDDDGANKNADDKGGDNASGNEDNAGNDGKGNDDGGAVSDHAPRIPVNLGGSKNRGGLSDLFNMAKGGR